MKHYLKNLAKTTCLGLTILLAMASCSNDNNQITPQTTGTEGLDMELTFNVSEAAEDAVFTRTTAMEPEVEHQTFMGMEVETSITEDSNTASNTRATAYNTVNLEGKFVYYTVFDPETNKALAATQMTKVTDNKITVKGKRGSKILFYIGNNPYISEGADLTQKTLYQARTTDPMQCISELITSENQDLGTLTFKHVYSKIRVILKSSNGSPVNAFRLSTQGSISAQYAYVNIWDRTYNASDNTMSLSFNVSENQTSEAIADYQHFIPLSSSTPTELTLVFATGGSGATIDGAKNYLTDVNNKLRLQSRTFLPGHRYSINITVKPASTERINSGYRQDNNYYQWDAYEKLGVGDKNIWSEGNSGGRFKTYYTNADAQQSCKDCPSLNEINMYIAAGMFFDDGHTGLNQQSYTITHPLTQEKTTYHAGAWLKKKQYIAGFAEGTAPTATSGTPTVGRPTPEQIDEYFFLPLAGYWDETPNQQNITLRYPGTIAYFMSKTVYNKTTTITYKARFYNLCIDNSSGTPKVQIRDLNWSAQNVASCTIWTAD